MNEELLVMIRLRAFNLMSTGRMMCSEAVLSVLNQGLGCGLPPDIAMNIVSGLPEGIGGSGCTCGALTGGVVSPPPLYREKKCLQTIHIRRK